MELPKDIEYYTIRVNVSNQLIEVPIAGWVEEIDNRKLVSGVYYIQRPSDIDSASLERLQAILKDKYPSLVKVEIKNFLRFCMRNPRTRQELKTLCQGERQL